MLHNTEEEPKPDSPLPEGFYTWSTIKQQPFLYSLVRNQAFAPDRPTREMLDAWLPLTKQVWGLIENDEALSTRLDQNDRLADDIGYGPGAGRSTLPRTVYVWSIRLVWAVLGYFVYLYITWML
jgi:hypothetical protein